MPKPKRTPRARAAARKAREAARAHERAETLDAIDAFEHKALRYTQGRQRPSTTRQRSFDAFDGGLREKHGDTRVLRLEWGEDVRTEAKRAAGRPRLVNKLVKDQRRGRNLRERGYL